MHSVSFARHENICGDTSSPDPACNAVLSSHAKTRNLLPRFLSTTSLMNQQFLCHAINHFTTKAKPPTDLAFFQNWITTLQNSSTSHTSLQASPLACCAAWFGRNDRNPSMIDYSRYLYTQGLQEVRKALRVPDLMLKDEMLGACLALTVFEVCECPDQSRAAYDWHRRANLNLLQMRGAHRHREGVGHELFLAARLHGVSVLDFVHLSLTQQKDPSARSLLNPSPDLPRLRPTQAQFSLHSRMANNPLATSLQRRFSLPRRHTSPRPSARP
jgi:hypothetical protein